MLQYLYTYSKSMMIYPIDDNEASRVFTNMSCFPNNTNVLIKQKVAFFICIHLQDQGDFWPSVCSPGTKHFSMWIHLCSTLSPAFNYNLYFGRHPYQSQDMDLHILHALSPFSDVVVSQIFWESLLDVCHRVCLTNQSFTVPIIWPTCCLFQSQVSGTIDEISKDTFSMLLYQSFVTEC